MNRLADYGDDLDTIIQPGGGLPDASKLEQEINRKFYSGGEDFWMYLAKKYDADFIVVRKSLIVAPVTLHIAYSNERFLILSNY